MPDLPSDKAKRHPWTSPAPRRAAAPATTAPYAELQVASNFSFLRGASHPDELMEQAAALGLHAAAITDRSTLAGIVRAHVAAKRAGVRLIVGSRLELAIEESECEQSVSRQDAKTQRDDSDRISRRDAETQRDIASSVSVSTLVFPTDRAAYGRLCRLLTRGKRRAPKGECRLTLHDLVEFQEGLLAIVLAPEASPGIAAPITDRFIEAVEGLRRVFDDRLSLAISRLYTNDDDARLEQLAALSTHVDVPLVATNDVHYHAPERRALQDVVTCIRGGVTIDRAGSRLFPNGERFLKDGAEMSRLFAAMPEAIARSVELADRVTFDLDELKYQYPDEVCPAGMSPDDYLRELVYRGACERFGAEATKRRSDGATEGEEQVSQHDSLPSSLRRFVAPSLSSRLEHELSLIAELGYATYFLTVYDIVAFARSQDILCQGRGAAANSAVCYCLGVTSVDPERVDMLFERFVSRERDEPPDIDVDFEHERREEVIQHIYAKYGRDRAALTAEVISYRGRSAVREVGKALGLSLDAVDRLAKQLDWWDKGVVKPERVRELGLDPDDPTVRLTLHLTDEILGFPRHLSQHVGGFVITQGLLEEMVPIENAAMEDRTVIEWDKDDIDAMGMLKVDCLGLGMLTCIRKAFAFVNQNRRNAEVAEVFAEAAEGGLGSDSEPEGLATDEHGLTRMARDRISRKAAKTQRSDALDSDSVKLSGSALYDLANGQRHQTGGSTGEGHAGVARGQSPASIPARSGARDQPHQQPPSGHDRAGGRARRSRRATETGMGGQGTTQFSGDEAGARPPDGGQQGDRRLHPVSLITDDSPRRTRRALSQKETSSQSETRSRSDSAISAFSAVNTSASSEHPSPPSATSAKPSATSAFSGSDLQLHTVPPEDPRVYDMICRADTVGVFQIESRAQMSMLPRLRPRCYYDLVIEVAIVRPGPIQGRMVHPYLRRRTGEEPVTYPSPEVRGVLERTLGVPLFQEQAMQLAVVAAGFTPGEADQLRRAMATWKRKGDSIGAFEDKFISGMLQRGYEREFADRCFEQIRGFGLYGFPESHAASFALLVYVSAWLKHHHPAAFAAALINSQPMGFYAPAQIVRDAKEHGVEVREVDVNFSGWDCRLEEVRGGSEISPRRARRSPSQTKTRVQTNQTPSDSLSPALRLGMRLVRGLAADDARLIEAAVDRRGSFDSIESLWRASGAPVKAFKALASADAFQSMGLDRRHALWEVRALRDDSLPLFEQEDESRSGASRSAAELQRRLSSEHPPSLSATSAFSDSSVALPPMPPDAAVAHDYATTGLSLKAHPMSFFRDDLDRRGVRPAADLRDPKACPQNQRVSVAGVVLMRQRPGTASGIVFMTLEDETGIANLIIRPRIYLRFRKAARHGVCLIVHGHVERQGEVVHVIVHRIEDMHDGDAPIRAKSRDFH